MKWGKVITTETFQNGVSIGVMVGTEETHQFDGDTAFRAFVQRLCEQMRTNHANDKVILELTFKGGAISTVRETRTGQMPRVRG